MSSLLPLLFPKYLIDDVVYGGCNLIIANYYCVICLCAHRSVLCSECLRLFRALRFERACLGGVEVCLFGWSELLLSGCGLKPYLV